MSGKQWALACGLTVMAVTVNLTGHYLLLSHFESRRAPETASIQNAPDAPVWFGPAASAPDGARSFHVPRGTEPDGFPSNTGALRQIDPPSSTVQFPEDSRDEFVPNLPGEDDPSPRGNRIARDAEGHMLPSRPIAEHAPPRASELENGPVIAPRPVEAGPLKTSWHDHKTQAEGTPPVHNRRPGADAVLREIIRQELPDATDSERRVWEAQLRGLKPNEARDLLQIRKLVGSDPLSEPESPTGGIQEIDPDRRSIPAFPRREPARRPVTGRERPLEAVPIEPASPTAGKSRTGS